MEELPEVKEHEPSQEFPGIGELFKESWNVFKGVLGKLLLLNVGAFVVSLVVFGIGVVSVIGIGVGFDFTKLFTPEGFLEFFSSIGPGVYATVGVTVLLVALIGLVVRLASIVLLGEGQIGVREALGQGLGLLGVFILTQVLVMFLLWGGLFVLVIPALVMGFFLVFVNYEIVLGKKKFNEAIRGSVAMVGQHAGEVLIRLLVFWVLYFFPRSIKFPIG